MITSHLSNHDVPNEQCDLQETSPSSLSQSSRENGESMAEGEVSTKSYKFLQNPDTERHSTVAELQVKVLEKDTDGTIRWVKVTHTESE